MDKFTTPSAIGKSSANRDVGLQVLLFVSLCIICLFCPQKVDFLKMSQRPSWSEVADGLCLQLHLFFKSASGAI